MLLNSYVEAEVEAKKNVDLLRRDIIDLSDTVGRLQWEITSKTQSSSELDRAIISKNKLHSELSIEIESLTYNLSQIRKDRLKEIESVSLELSALREDSRKLSTDIELLKEQKQKHKKTVDELWLSIVSLSSQLQRLQWLINTQESLKEDLSDREEKVKQKEKELQNYESRLHARYIDIQSIKAKLDKRETNVLVKEDNAKKIIEKAVKNK